MKNTKKNYMKIIINQKYAVTFGFPNSKKNNFRGNYMRKYGILILYAFNMEVIQKLQ